VVIAGTVAFSGKDFPLALVGDSFAESWLWCWAASASRYLCCCCTAGAPGSATSGWRFAATNAPQTSSAVAVPAIMQ